MVAGSLIAQEGDVVNRGGLLYRREMVPDRVPVTSVETVAQTETTYRVAERTTRVDQLRPHWTPKEQVVPRTQIYVPNRPGLPPIAVTQNVPTTTFELTYDKVQIPVTTREWVPETRTVERPTRVLAWKETQTERLTYLGPAPTDGRRYADNSGTNPSAAYNPGPPPANIPGDRHAGSAGPYQPPPSPFGGGALGGGAIVARDRWAMGGGTGPAASHPSYIGGVSRYNGEDPPRVGPALR